ncbi:MAG: hypothetical protein K2N48_11360 [Muribaculaceae bacterium]|nr:hypothetical protein [Muribaculaceae bacterium]
MNLYKIYLNYKFAISDVEKYDGNVDYLSLNSETTSILKSFEFGWQTVESSVIPDITIIMSKLFCIDKKAANTLLSYLNGIVLTPISIGNKIFNSLSHIPILNRALDMKSSKVKYFSTGDIMEITRPVFKKQEYPNLFKIDEISGTFFCTHELKNIVEINNLTGISFEECKVKQKSWFGL